ncbi:unnamed protein product [Vicia faba]|uniref:DDE Tnp4 domain-containing protein n=1 Tax=Vicia faba TaxID=3906 RepID=A0AAV0ZDZ9_VICFA|nr:unnamed protein product [Vicia faba]
MNRAVFHELCEMLKGALDGNYIKVNVPEADKCRFRTRKGGIATNVLGVCSPDLQFIHVLPGWEGSTADSRVLRDVISPPNGLRFPQGYYYLCDDAYMNREGFLTPYRGQRYHLKMTRDPLEMDLGDVESSNEFMSDEMITVVEPSNAWSQWRDNLALENFNRWRSGNHR